MTEDPIDTSQGKIGGRKEMKRSAILALLLSCLVPWSLAQSASPTVTQATGPAREVDRRPSAAASLALKKPDTCVACHTQMEGALAAPVTQMQDDVHHQRGLSCADCHGGDASQTDPVLAMDPRKGFVGKPKPKAVQSFCGECHSNADFMKKYNPSLRVDQEAEYKTSVHGKLVAKGDGKVATCISCHGFHGVRAVKDPNAPVYPTQVADTCGRCHASPDYMRPYSIPTDQVAKYHTSVHAEALLKKQDLSAPTCNDCHGNHGAAPPGVTSVANVCGTCHSRQAELFQASPHKPVFDAMQLGECLVCHGNHDIRPPTDEMLGVSERAACVRCHSPGDTGFQSAQVMRQGIDELVQHLHQAQALLDRAARAGMEVSRAKFELNDAHDKLVNARVVVHSFSLAELQEVAKPGVEVARKAHQSGLDALAELQFRRKGLAASLLVILLAVAAVYWKVREIEGRSQ
ncbi:MAG: cytochrome c3 family protein [Acidobacteriota bacterium]